MLDIKFIRENPDAVKENIKKKFQEQKLPLVAVSYTHLDVYKRQPHPSPPRPAPHFPTRRAPGPQRSSKRRRAMA